MRSIQWRTGLISLFGLGLSACATPVAAPPAPAPQAIAQTAERPAGMIAAAHPDAVEDGLAVLRAGGSAIDATAAVLATLTMVEPQSSGLGGGAFITYYDAETRAITVYDGRETAPAGATGDMFLRPDGTEMTYFEAKHSGRSIGVPGAVAMLKLAHDDHGRLAWPALFEGSIARAEGGYAISARTSNMLTRFARYGVSESADMQALFYDTSGAPLPGGAIVTNPEYARALRAIAADPRVMYEGWLADEIVAASAEEPLPGTLSRADLASYQARRHAPICAPYKGLEVCGPPSPSSGGIAIAMILGLLSHHDFSADGAADPGNWHLFVEAQRLAYADRDRFVGDQDFVAVPVEGLLHAAYLADRAALIDPGRAMPTAEPGDPWAYMPGAVPALAGVDASDDTPGTSHFVVVDGAGNVASVTATIEGPFGALRTAGGMLLNNELTDFSFKPVDADGTPIANRIEPGKRPRSSMSPTIVLDPDRNFLFATGSPGGNSIIAYVAKSVVGVLGWGLDPQAAVELPNVVARGEVRVEADVAGWEWLAPAIAAYGAPMGESRGEASGLHSVLVAPDGTYVGAADPRRDGVARAP